MWNVFEQPWLLLIITAIDLITVIIITKINRNKKLRLLYIIPILTFVLAFGLDYFVQTDREKITAVISKGVKAVEQEDVGTIDKITSPAYSDLFHPDKAALMSHCRTVFSEPLIKKNYKTILSTEISPPNATVDLIVRTVFDERSFAGQNLKQLLTKTRLELQKSGNDWLISKVEVLEINRHPASWKDIQSPLSW